VFGGRSRVSGGDRTGVSYQDSRDERRQGVFTSPNHPHVYPTSVNCVLYTFIAAPQQIVEITFNDFNLQIPATSKSEHVPLFGRESVGWFKRNPVTAPFNSERLRSVRGSCPAAIHFYAVTA